MVERREEEEWVVKFESKLELDYRGGKSLNGLVEVASNSERGKVATS